MSTEIKNSQNVTHFKYSTMNFHNVFEAHLHCMSHSKEFGGNGALGKWTALAEALTHALMHHWAAAAMQNAANSVSCPRTLTTCMWTVRGKTRTAGLSIAGQTASTEPQIR